MGIEPVQTTDAPAAIGPYSQGIFAGPYLFISGQLPINPADDTINADVKEQVQQSLKNLQAIVESAGGTLGNIVKTTIFIKEMDDLALINEVYGQFFNNHHPARSMIEVSRIPKDAKIEIEAIAYLG